MRNTTVFSFVLSSKRIWLPYLNELIYYKWNCLDLNIKTKERNLTTPLLIYQFSKHNGCPITQGPVVVMTTPNGVIIWKKGTSLTYALYSDI